MIYDYDELGRLKVVSDDIGKVVNYGLDPAGNRLSRTTSTGAVSAGTVRFSTSSYGVSEGQGVLQVKVLRAGGRFGAASVNYSAASGTAISGADFTLTPGTLSWANGEAGEKSFNVTIIDDALYEGSESFTVSLSAASGASLGTPASIPITITDNEPPDTQPPTVPTGLTGTAPASRQVNLSWNASSDPGGSGVGGYRVYRAQGSTPTQIGSTATNSYVDTTTLGTQTYLYTVAAYDNANPANLSAQSSGFSITTPDTEDPTIPTGLTATAVAYNRIDLTWNASTDPGGSGIWYYRLYRNGSFHAAVTGTSYSDTPSPAPGTTYSYTVEAVDWGDRRSGQSSPPVSATTPAAPPMNPPGVPSWSGGYGGCTSTCDTGGSENLVWTDGAGDPPTYWEVEVSANFGSTWSGWSSPVTRNALVTIPFNATRQYRVRACNLSGCGAYSSVIGFYYNPNP